ncbi:MAG: hypothetical protein GX986_07180 [Firmicutes bacterium]|nr:hypothetical protein [Bacillota bacterium]
MEHKAPLDNTAKSQSVSSVFADHLQGAMDAAISRRVDDQLEVVQRQAGFGIKADNGPSLEEQRRQLWDAAVQLESLFLNQLVSTMQRTIPRGEGILSESKAEEIFRGMLDEEWAELMAKSGDTGLAKLLYDQLAQSLEDGPKD